MKFLRIILGMFFIFGVSVYHLFFKYNGVVEKNGLTLRRIHSYNGNTSKFVKSQLEVIDKRAEGNSFEFVVKQLGTIDKKERETSSDFMIKQPGAINKKEREISSEFLIKQHAAIDKKERDISSEFMIKQSGAIDKKESKISSEFMIKQLEAVDKNASDIWWETEQMKRKLRIQQVCSSMQQRRINFGSFLYDPNHQLLYCKNAKVGTSTWMRHFLSLSNLPQGKKDKIFSSSNKHHAISKRFSIPSYSNSTVPNWLNQTVSFSFVRHPFERLVSAFEDKFSPQTNKKGIKKIRQSYETKYLNILLNYGNVTFANFAKFLLAEKRELPADQLNIHWRPYNARCYYCRLPYTVIGKMETYQDDFNHISDAANIDLVNKHEHAHSIDAPSKPSTESLTHLYFSQMPEDLVESLYRMYKIDFDMFDYDPWKYSINK